MARAARQLRLGEAGGEVQRGADAGAARFQEAVRSPATDRDPRVSLSARAGLRLRGARGRRGAGWNRSDVQPARGPAPAG